MDGKQNTRKKEEVNRIGVDYTAGRRRVQNRQTMSGELSVWSGHLAAGIPLRSDYFFTAGLKFDKGISF